MGNMFDYLDWRGDLTLVQDPFNEVDNLLFAELSYTDFEGVFEEEREYTIEETAEKYYTLHTEEEVRARTSFIGQAPLLLKPMAASRRFRNLTLSGYTNVVDESREEQFAALVFRVREEGCPEPLVYVAYRGTDDNLVGWKEDFNLSYLSQTPSQQSAVRYLEQQMGGSSETFYVGGHSKGGNLAIYAAAFADEELQDRIRGVYSNDGPGFREEIVESAGYRAILPKIESFVPEFSVIGMLLNNFLKHRVIRSSQKAVMQHDALSWQVLGRRFVQAPERTEGSVFLDTTLSSWIDSLDDAEREEFVDRLFDLFDAPGEHTLEGLQKLGVRSIGDMLKAMRALPPEERKSFDRILRKLVQSGGEALFGDLKGDLKQKVAAAQGWIRNEEPKTDAEDVHETEEQGDREEEMPEPPSLGRNEQE